MNKRRILPYVEDKTLDSFIDRLANEGVDKAVEYLERISNKMERNNLLLEMFTNGSQSYLPSRGVYELLYLSLKPGEILPIVTRGVIRVLCLPDSSEFRQELGDFSDNIGNENPNIKKFLSEYYKDYEDHLFWGSLTYMALRMQSVRDNDKMERIIRSN
ncbi:MAG: hypothetical protein AABW89_02635 [Nanoarchaeota archaeon]